MATEPKCILRAQVKFDPLMTLHDRQADDDGRLVQKTVNSHRLCDRPSWIPDKDELVRIRKIPRQNRHAALRELLQDA